jgi:hypothetical protein
MNRLVRNKTSLFLLPLLFELGILFSVNIFYSENYYNKFFKLTCFYSLFFIVISNSSVFILFIAALVLNILHALK